MRSAFTLIELMVSITILAIIMIFLHKSYASLNRSNHFYKDQIVDVKTTQLKKRVLFLDLSLALPKSVKILNQDKKEDIVFFQTTNSMHKRYNPFVAYIFKDSKLYRLESLRKFTSYPLSLDAEFSVEFFGDAKSFRIYKSDKKDEAYLVHIDFKDEDDILLKIKVLG